MAPRRGGGATRWLGGCRRGLGEERGAGEARRRLARRWSAGGPVRSAAAAVAALLLSWPYIGTAQLDLLLRGTLSAPPVAAPTLDPLLPTGPPLSDSEHPRPARGASRLCGRIRPVCVHAAEGVGPAAVSRWLDALEGAHRALVGVLDLPAPLPDLNAGGGPELDLYVSPGSRGLEVSRDRLGTLRRDRASAFCAVGAAAAESAARASTRCVAEAIAFALDAAQGSEARAALAQYLWWLIGRPESADAGLVDSAQIEPGAPAWRESGRGAGGGALLLEFLDRTRGQADGSLPVALSALAARRTGAEAHQWLHEPDAFDVMRASFDGLDHGLARALGEFSVQRAFLGDRDAERRAPLLDWLGSAGRVRFDWVVPWSSLPRNLAPRRPLGATGAMYIWLAIDQPAADLTLGFRASWEHSASFHWSLIKIARDGRRLGAVQVPFLERGSSVDRTVVDLEGVAALLVVGTHLGGLGPSHPYDPDVAPAEPHGCTVYLAAL